ncbi:MAG: rRNA maturation RNase YbeY [Muribaculaceae bacterium]|nr:rRNA maturation RNase YbeY [Muribaculaceae bacterium]MDY3933307.1 rRNA maturation RNase YbeY [Muribaculaceae bacterium]
MTEISYTTDGVEMPSFDTQRIENWIVSVARGFGKTVGAVTYIFCNDDKILEVNRKYINHDYYTDIITFDYSRPMRISGDVFISLDTVRSNAILLGKTYDNELMRVIIHGILHLCGVDDKGPGEREIMERHEDEALALLSNM